MPDYKAMYFKLFRAYSKVIGILSEATLETEEMEMDSSDPVFFPEPPSQAEKDTEE